ncbi:MAG: hypothetical protein KGL39_37440 [Patescibacteria group bacterium]|nr:hypothetical protein [Patescibacteria group bacterium]
MKTNPHKCGPDDGPVFTDQQQPETGLVGPTTDPALSANKLFAGTLEGWVKALPTIEFWHAGLAGVHCKLTRPNGTVEFNTKIQDVPVSMIGRKYALVEIE